VHLLLIRHALPQRIELTEGRADPELAPLGWEQAGRLAAWLLAEPLDAVCSSPLRRAVQTAEPLAEATGHVVEIVDGLAEWDRDSSSYVPIEELRAADDPVWKSLAAGALHELGVDGPGFQARVVAAIDGIAADRPDQVVAVVCHGGVLNAYLSAVLGLDRMLFFPPDYTCINRVEVGRTGKRLLRSLNETPHLRGLG
jgi:2,3-bisphosphoglycerate-dependent phosphoglycerate mutase